MTSLPRPTRFEVPRHRVGPLPWHLPASCGAAAGGLVALALIGWADPAYGQARESGSGWSVQLTPYLWMIGIEGDLATLSGVPSVEVDWSFADVLDNLDFAFASFLEARHGAFSVLTELSYLRLGGEADLRGALLDDVTLTTGVLFVTGFTTYEALVGRGWQLDALAGARVWHARTELDLGPGLLPGRRSDESEAWVDPLVGARIRIDLGRGVSATGLADVGGFDIGSAVTWEMMATVDFRFNERILGHAGYRHMRVDYQDGDFLYDVELSGPIVAATFQF
jgi:hypothetical protein